MDWLAGILELIASWLIGNKKKIGFVLNILGGLCWIYVAVTKSVYGLLIVVLPAIVMNVRNFLKWKKARWAQIRYMSRNYGT